MSVPLSPALPMEMIHEIIEALAPPVTDAILPAPHVITKTLLAFSYVCRGTRAKVSRLLRRYCVYIDSPAKAQALARCLTSSVESAEDQKLSRLGAVSSLFLSPFEETTEDLDLEEEEEEYHPYVSPLHDEPTVNAVYDILVAVAPTLRRLVIDMPLRSLPSREDQHGVRPCLRQGFEALTNLEDFASMQDDLYLETLYDLSCPELWFSWPKLRRLMLYNPCIVAEKSFWSSMAGLKHLKMVIWARPDFTPYPEPDGDNYDGDTYLGLPVLDIKSQWLSGLSNSSAPQVSQRPQDMTFVFVDVKQNQPDLLADKTWHSTDPENCVRVLLADVPFPKGSGDPADPTTCTQSFLRKHALKGTLWDEEEMDMYDAPYKPLDAAA